MNSCIGHLKQTKWLVHHLTLCWGSQSESFLSQFVLKKNKTQINLNKDQIQNKTASVVKTICSANCFLNLQHFGMSFCFKFSSSTSKIVPLPIYKPHSNKTLEYRLLPYFNITRSFQCLHNNYIDAGRFSTHCSSTSI